MRPQQKIRTELVLRDDAKTARIIHNVCALHRQNKRLALERSIFAAAFAVTLFLLVYVLYAWR